MKKGLLFLSVFLLNFILAEAQTRVVTGLVTSEDNGNPIPGVNVVLQGTSIGEITDVDGYYTITVPEEGGVLVFSFIGLATREVEISNQSEINVVMSADIQQLSEVVVTAIGIERERRGLSYAVENVESETLTKASRTSMIDALAGRVAGVRINSSSGDAGASSFIEIRGAASITRSNQPLFVIDGVPIDNSGNSGNTVGGVAESNRAMDLNPNDIENISILKGGAATALYGIRAANGAVIITTKKGGNTGGKVQVNYNSFVKLNEPSLLPELQTKYAQGSEIYMGLYDRTGVQMPDEQIYNAVAWGPPIDELRYSTDPNYVPGDEYPFGGITPMDEYIRLWDPNGRMVPAGSPFASNIPVQAYDHYDFFRTGTTFQNHIDVSGGDEKSTFYLSLSNNSDEGIVPNNSFNRTSVKLTGSTKINNDLKVTASTNFISSKGDRVQKGSNVSGVMLGLTRTPPTFDNSYLYQWPNGKQRTYRGGGGYDNPYWTVNKNRYIDRVNRLIGFAQLDYQTNDWLSFTYRFGLDNWNKDVKNYFEIGSADSPEGYNLDENEFSTDINSDLMMNINTKFGQDWDFGLLLGHNIYQSTVESTSAEAFGLQSLEFYNIANTTDARGSESNFRKRTAAFYGDMTLSYRNMLYLNATARNEWSTTLPEDNNSFFYPSVGLGFVLTEIPALSGSNIVNFAKLRASYTEIANDAAAYATRTYYFQPNPADGWTTPNGIQFPFLGSNAYTLGNTIGNNQIRPERMDTWELGLDMSLIQNRLAVDVAYFNTTNSDLLLSVPIATSTGYEAAYLNAGTMETNGFEVVINAIPVKTSDFQWSINMNWSNPYSEVTQLAEGVENVFLSGFTEPQVRAVVGSPYRSLFGLRWSRTNDGQVLINDNPNDPFMDGFPFSDPSMQEMGTVQPDWTAGITNSFTYKGFSLSALLDIKEGGLMWNGTKGALYYFGTHKDTETRGESKVWDGVYGHVNSDGDVVHYQREAGELVTDADGNFIEVPGPGPANTSEVVVDEDWYWWSGEGSGFTGPSEPYVEEADWVRLREVTFSYQFSPNFLDNIFINNLELYFTGINLWIDTPYTGVDPETSLVGNNNGLGIDYFNNPGVRSYIFGLRVGL
ncbi:MAG: SusC/RagA family TonB-linked outer membrane protein [Candidatus Cyclobacteriaceae bacterium M3_2C_046]